MEAADKLFAQVKGFLCCSALIRIICRIEMQKLDPCTPGFFSIFQ